MSGGNPPRELTAGSATLRHQAKRQGGEVDGLLKSHCRISPRLIYYAADLHMQFRVQRQRGCGSVFSSCFAVINLPLLSKAFPSLTAGHCRISSSSPSDFFSLRIRQSNELTVRSLTNRRSHSECRTEVFFTPPPSPPPPPRPNAH